MTNFRFLFVVIEKNNYVEELAILYGKTAGKKVGALARHLLEVIPTNFHRFFSKGICY